MLDQPSCLACPARYYQNEEGKFYCDEAKKDTVLKPSLRNGKEVLEEWTCPEIAMECNDVGIVYRGNVWHNPNATYPDSNMLYVCVNDGCPDKNSTKMECKEGYKPDSPLCALCDDGYFASLRECIECKEPQYALLVVFVVVMALVVMGVVCVFYRFSHYLSPTLMTHFKILVGFVTILATIDTAFGVQWPSQFSAMLNFISALTFDPTAIAHGLCLFEISFYDSLVFSTSGLVVVLIAIGIFAAPTHNGKPSA